MSPLERLACRNGLWRWFTARAVVPWVLGTREVGAEVVELGCGAGANAAAVLERHPRCRLTATDLDPRMVEAAAARLARFGDRAVVEVADATRLRYDDATFDAVVSMLMLHHVGDTPAAIAEAARVLRPGGLLVGYDLLRSGHGRQRPADLRAAMVDAGFVDVDVRPGLGGLVARFAARRSD